MPTTLGIQVKTSGAKPFEERCDALVLFVPQKNHEYFQVFRTVDQKTKKTLSSLLKSERFVGKIGESITYHTNHSLAPSRLIITGLGELKNINEEMFRRAAGVAAITARRAASSHVAYTVPSELNIQQERLLQSIVEGALLGSYRYLKFKTKEEEIEPEKKVETITVLSDPNSLSRNAIKRAQIMSEATCFARDLVNEPGNNLNPATLAQIAKEVAREKGLAIRVLEAPELERLGAGAILGVGSGSSVPPRLIQLTYRSGQKKKGVKTALVGKGITFDSGGLS
ncbi:MAG TPA: M17 family peptidase N-terminal domain-containing protein, partial [Acidobacteriota bacterium]|nr:M17 family peptidase N-terminal domain-containing protein [Acidobacteriota bacterium]